ncbi:MAG TPA: anti-sigma factor [Thermoanaerobaculia bacterium]|nr:anti-sigma factor [Thermoanaerobaculia bacterium]
MSCADREQQIGAYLDGELDLTDALEIERHFELCPSCARRLAAQQALHEAISDAAPALRFRPSPRQSRRLRAALRDAPDDRDVPDARDGRRMAAPPAGGRSFRHAGPAAAVRHFRAAAAANGSSGVGRAAFPGGLFRQVAWIREQWRALPQMKGLQAAALLAVAVAAFTLGRSWPARPAASLVSEEVVSSHVRSLLAGHTQEVASSDRHTVKPWFSGKLDYAPTVIDLAAAGFPLRGGRLDYVAHKPVAALVYQSDHHVINLFTWPSSYTGAPAAAGPAANSWQGFHLLHWSQDGMTYYAVSDLAANRLRQFADLFAQQLARSDPT